MFSFRYVNFSKDVFFEIDVQIRYQCFDIEARNAPIFLFWVFCKFSDSKFKILHDFISSFANKETGEPGFTTPVVTHYGAALYISPIKAKTRNKNLGTKHGAHGYTLVWMFCAQGFTVVRRPCTPWKKIMNSCAFFSKFCVFNYENVVRT